MHIYFAYTKTSTTNGRPLSTHRPHQHVSPPSLCSYRPPSLNSTYASRLSLTKSQLAVISEQPLPPSKTSIQISSYPIRASILFHDTIVSPLHARAIRAGHRTNITFLHIRWYAPPDTQDQVRALTFYTHARTHIYQLTTKVKGGSVGYRHMIHLFASQFALHPAVASLGLPQNFTHRQRLQHFLQHSSVCNHNTPLPLQPTQRQ